MIRIFGDILLCSTMQERSEKTLTRITGKSVLYSLGIALIGVVLLAFVYGLMNTIVRVWNGGEQVELGTFLFDVFGFFKLMGVCAGPIIFLLSFALLQRIRLPW